LRIAGWPRSRVVAMWLAVVLVSAISAAAGYVLLDPASGRTGALAQAFAAGALLAMLADTLLPEAYAVEGLWTGPLVVGGFAASIALAAL
jgi:zinc transporter, ZIP family